jgi:outer membrane biosynthesis protein TonB
MNYILCRNRVRNFDYWKGVFDSHADRHRAAGLKLVHLWYELNSPRNVFFLFEVEDFERARAFLDTFETAASARESGLIEGDVRFLSESLGYGPLNEAQSHAFATAAGNVASMTAEPAKSPEPAESPEPVKTPEPAKSAEPEKRPSLGENFPGTSEPVKNAEPEKEPTPAEPVKPSLPPMKGLERVKSTQPAEPFEGWKPVENWPPAEEAADTAAQAPSESAQHRRWVRMKY